MIMMQKYLKELELAVCNGMLDDQLVCAEKSNLYFATDLLK